MIRFSVADTLAGEKRIQGEGAEWLRELRGEGRGHCVDVARTKRRVMTHKTPVLSIRSFRSQNPPILR